VRARTIVALIALAATGAAAPRLLHAHPLHSTITELVEDRSRGVVRATIRVFADDFGTAVARSTSGRLSPSSGPAWDAAASAYSISAFGIEDSAGRALALRSCGVRRTGVLLWLCLEAATTRSLSELRVRNGMLCELFEDQVNVVQVAVGVDRRSLLFVRGDHYKPVR
jgi:hypothetical protein